MSHLPMRATCPGHLILLDYEAPQNALFFILLLRHSCNVQTFRSLPFSNTVCVTFEVFTAVRMMMIMIMLFWLLTQCRVVGRCHPFGETCCFHLHGWSNKAAKCKDYIGQMFPNWGGGAVLLVLGGEFFLRGTFILNEIWTQDEVCVFLGTLLGSDMNLAVFFNLIFIELYTNL
jgi:hypothetical protein